jgi:hypothetical protein
MEEYKQKESISKKLRIERRQRILRDYRKKRQNIVFIECWQNPKALEEKTVHRKKLKGSSYLVWRLSCQEFQDSLVC